MLLTKGDISGVWPSVDERPDKTQYKTNSQTAVDKRKARANANSQTAKKRKGQTPAQ